MFEQATELALTQRRMARRKVEYLNNPKLWAEERAGVHLWSKQADVAMSVAENHDVIVKAGHGVGKSMLAGLLICWWVDTRYPDGRVASTAPSVSQVGAIVWYEVRKIFAKVQKRYEEGLTYAPLPGYITAENRWKTDEGLEVGAGRKPPERDMDSAFQGIHAAKGVLALGDEACHDADTDVLTGGGWKNWSEVTDQDRFLTWDTTSNSVGYESPSRIVAYPYEGEMVHYKNETTDFMVTPNHEMIFDAYIRRGQFERKQAGDLTYSNKYMRRTIQNWIGEEPETFTLPAYQSERKSFPELIFRADDWARFLGWFGSEGSLDKNGYAVHIWQVKEAGRQDIRALLTRMGLEFSEYGDDQFAVYGGQLSAYLQQFGRTTVDKHVPDVVRGWSTRLIREYLDAYVLGDGYRNGARRIIYTSGERMSRDIHELALKAGYNSTVIERPPVTGVPLKDGRRITSTRTGYVISLSESDVQIRLRPEHVERVAYSGMVYCATVPKNRSLFTRRNGKTLWSGNCGLSKDMIDALGNITTTAESRRFLILNPTNPASYTGEIFREDLPNWTKHTISVFDSPNFTGEEVPPEVARALTDQSFVDAKKAEYGEGSPRYMSRVLGEFAFDLDASLIVLEDIAVAHDLDIPVSGNRPILGVDVARFGKDLSVIYSNDNGRVRFHSSWGMTDGVSTAEKIHKAVLETGAIEVRIDGSGIGGPIADVLNRLRTDSGSDYEIIEMMGGWAAPDNQEHSNARSYWFDKFRYDLRAGKFDLDFADTKATEELLAIQYAFRAGSNALKMESKDDMRRRGAKSPDYADAIIYCVADMEYLRNPTPTGRILMETEVFSSESRNDPVLDCLNW